MGFTCSPSVLKWPSVFFKANHKSNRKEKKTNKPKLGKKIPEQQERVSVSAVYITTARERGTVKIFASPQPTGKLVLSTEQPQPTAVGPPVYVHSQRPKVFPLLRQVFQPCERANLTFFLHMCKAVDMPLNNLCHSILYTLAGSLSLFVTVAWNKYLYLNSIMLPYIFKQISKL